MPGQDAELALDRAGEDRVASPDQIAASMETSSTCIVAIELSAVSFELVGLALEVLEATAHEERLLRVAVELAVRPAA